VDRTKPVTVTAMSIGFSRIHRYLQLLQVVVKRASIRLEPHYTQPCDFPIVSKAFDQYAKERTTYFASARLSMVLHAVHKILKQEANAEEDVLPIGQVSQEAQETLN
jgi:hypothetical protein